MALINRFSRLFTADLHAVLDRIEEPEALLKQAVRDMEEELVKMRSRAKSIRLNIEKLGQQQTLIDARLGDLDEELDVCFGSNEDALAKNLVKRKLESERRLESIRSRYDLEMNTLQTSEAAIAEAEQQLEAMQQKLETFISDAPSSNTPAYDTSEYTIGNDEVEVAFLREKQRRGQ